MDRENQFVGESGAFLDAVEQASRAAPLDRPVLVIGERGTGKELIAERLHRLSRRWDGPLITLNCAALPETLIEAELFGHEAGAFTGATRARAGAFEEADGGTLFLDELATLSAAAQERLLRAVEYGEVSRIGSNTPINVDVRIVAATNENLPALVDREQFRADLLDRLSFEVITLPPLRVRERDILILADYFGRRMAVELDWPGWPGFGDRATDALEAHDWPGNVRELRNVVERAVYRWDAPNDPIDRIQLDPFDSPWAFPEPSAKSDEQQEETSGSAPAPAAPVTDDFKSAVEEYEKRLLETALERARFNQRQTAKALGLTYDQLRHALKRHELIG
ncbi:MAG: phage shock protein operon transcriptional activator [Parasphingopyxis sp.]|nr:phage shock protein operon transcriptional activator [Sphingomonadales bacterium]